MAQSTHDSEVTFRLLESLTNEDIPESEQNTKLYEKYNKLQELVYQELLSLTEETPYPRKYETYDRIQELLQTVRLHMLVSELTDKRILGFYHPTNAQLTEIWKKWLTNALPDTLSEKPLWQRLLVKIAPKSQGYNSILYGVPTLIVPAGQKVPNTISAISIGEKRIDLTQDDYVEMLCQDRKAIEAEDRVDLSSLAHLLIVSSDQISDKQSVLIVPSRCNANSKYFSALLGLIDTLVQCDKKIQLDKLSWLEGSNVKHIISWGKDVELLSKRLHLRHFAPDCTITESFPQIDTKKETKACHNANHGLVLQSIISEVLWYLGIQRHSLNERLATINPDTLDEQATGIVKEIKEEVAKQLDASDSLCKRYLALMTEMDEHLKQIAEAQQNSEAAAAHNDHAISSYGLLGHMFRMCVFYGIVEQQSHKETMQTVRKLQESCSQAADGRLANIIANDFFKKPSSSDELNALKTTISQEPFISRLKLRHRQELSLDDAACGALVQALPQPRTPEEERILGIHLKQNGKDKQARKALYSALTQGDQEAGEAFLEYFGQEEKTQQNAALFGVAQAALLIGKNKLDLWEKHQSDTALFAETLKFLNIAAAGGAPAYSCLCDLWYSEGVRLLAANGEEDENMKAAFRACLLNASSMSRTGKKRYERMGTAAYHLKQYSEAKEYLEKADTADAHALLGKMYENGTGMAQDRDTALKEYEKAMELGHTQAKVDYDRLFAALQAEKEAKEASERSSYSASSYYSGYYSYYSGGW
ncbi:MAG: hypothetical protein Q4F00_12095 [bacterium]|nr:hypothetical protein [bacterium]